ncbi:ExbD/TolR family protein, partial [Klebsiella michiganensis]
LKQQQQENQTTTIIVNSDKEVAVERLIAVMDTLRQGGFFSISIATRKQ